jgi:replicative DNA helicase
MKHIRAAAKLEKTDLLVVDYLQRIKPADNRRNRNEQIGEMTRGLSELAKELSIPVVCLCQLNRESEGQTPKLSHLRESGDIEQDANIILAIHTIKDENDEETPHKEIHILKNREGSMGKIQLAWKPAAVRFEDDTELPF